MAASTPAEKPGFRLALALAGSSAGVPTRLEDGLRRQVGAECQILRTPTGAIVVCLPFDRTADRRAFAEATRVDLAARARDRALTVGVGGPQNRSLLGRAILHAEHALWLGRALYGDGRTILFEDLGQYRFISGQPRSEIRGFVDSVLGPLSSPGARNDELIHTLETYLRAQGNQKAVARTLKLHRNTVRQRLERIRVLTGPRLSDSDGRLELRLAIIARHALHYLSPVDGKAVERVRRSEVAHGPQSG